jgi:hypothetical protein
MKTSSPEIFSALTPRLSARHTSLIAIGILTGLLYAGEATSGQSDCAAGDESHLIARVTQMHEAISSNDLASWYSLSSSRDRSGRHLEFEEFERTNRLDDPYGSLEGWTLRGAEIERLCGSAEAAPAGKTPTCRSAVLVALSFANSERAEVVEVWERVDGEWYWSFTDRQRACTVLH